MWDTEDPLGGILSKAREQPLHSNLARVAHDWTISPSLLNHVVVSLNRLANPNNSVHADVDGGALLGIKNFSHCPASPLVNWGGGTVRQPPDSGRPAILPACDNRVGVRRTRLVGAAESTLSRLGVDIRATHVNSRGGPGGVFNFNANSHGHSERSLLWKPDGLQLCIVPARHRADAGRQFFATRGLGRPPQVLRGPLSRTTGR